MVAQWVKDLAWSLLGLWLQLWHRFSTLARKFHNKKEKCIFGMLSHSEKLGVPTVAQWNRVYLLNTRTQVPSLASHSGLGIRHCSSCSIAHNRGSELIPVPGTPYAIGQPKNKKKKMSLLFTCIKLSTRKSSY